MLVDGSAVGYLIAVMTQAKRREHRDDFAAPQSSVRLGFGFDLQGRALG